MTGPEAKVAGDAVEFTLNGRVVTAKSSPQSPAGEALRDEFGLTSVRIGCADATCGACLILVEGRARNSCRLPLGQLAHHAVATVEGLAAHGTLTRVQRAFLGRGVAQCGFCMPGMLLAAVEILAEKSAPSPAEVAAAIGRVRCACNPTDALVAAVLEAVGEVPMPHHLDARQMEDVAKLTGAIHFAADR
jgi:aerobic-type carbon monoxide dehydrogenase small subunit (CoxS/CutS family)